VELGIRSEETGQQDFERFVGWWTSSPCPPIDPALENAAFEVIELLGGPRANIRTLKTFVNDNTTGEHHQSDLDAYMDFLNEGGSDWLMQ